MLKLKIYYFTWGVKCQFLHNVICECYLIALFAARFQGDLIPGPLPLGVAVIDASVRLYGFVFPLVAQKHRVQMLEHFSECIKQAKSSRQQAVQINIFTAVLCALKVGSSIICTVDSNMVIVFMK